MLSRATQDERGLTLVEAAVGGFLLLVGVLGSISVFDSSGRESATGERQQIAVEQAKAELERMRDVPDAELAIDPTVAPGSATAWPNAGTPGDPVNRLDGGGANFRVGPGDTERIVYTTAGEGISGSSTIPVTMGSSAMGLTVYRFVTWRDEECPIADLGGLVNGFEPLTSAVGSEIAPLLGPGSILNALLGSLLSVVPVPVRSRLNSAKTLATTAQNMIIELNDALGHLEEVDPCDADVAALSEAQDNLALLAPAIDAVDDAVLAYRNACVRVGSVVVSCPTLGSATGATLNNAVSALENGNLDERLDDLIDSISAIDTVDHERNTKRLTVAIAIEDRQGSGPFKPVWATSISSDPDAGLLSP